MAAPAVETALSLKSILFATDFSSYSQAALPFAAALARQQEAKIYIAHVIPMESVWPVELDLAEQPASDPSDPRFLIHDALADPALDGIEHQAVMKQGETGPALRYLISRYSPDMVVVGTHGREGLKKLVLGSVAEEIIRTAPCPVLTVGPHVAFGCLDGGRLRRLLYATDFSANADRALPYAIFLAETHHAQLDFLHVVRCAFPVNQDSPERFVHEKESARAELRKRVPKGNSGEVQVRAGLPDEVINAVARDARASLIVLGTHARSPFFAGHLPGTTAHRVITGAPCPVLMVP